MKHLLLALSITLSCSISSAQRIDTDDITFLKKKEDSLKVLSTKIIQGINSSDRFLADSGFTKMLVRALKTRNSFYFPFDSLATISRLYAPDSSFRIFTWQMMISDNMIRQHGAIQMKTEDGSLKLYPLIDKSDVTINQEDTIGNNFGWIGAVYYKIVLKESNGQKYYTLLGYDENNIRSTKKIIEVLNFITGEPQFGGNFFLMDNKPGSKKVQSRFIMEFKKNAGARLTYDADLDMIVKEHLISETNEPKKKWTYVGDGDYEGFKWTGGRWVFNEKIFNMVTPEGKEPVPMPMRDEKGNITDEKLKGDLPSLDEPSTDTEKKPEVKKKTPVKKTGK